jgi:beta-lactamase regulating signal transducer with metallopeptidase domain
MNQAINDCLNGWNSLGKAFCGYAGSAFVQSALLVILLLALDVLWHKRVRAVFRYCVWLLVLLKLVLPPTLSLPTGIGYWVGDHLPIATDVSERVSLPMGDGRLEQHPPAAAQVSATAPPVPPSPEVAEPAAPAAPAVVPPTSLTWQGIVLLFWSAGVLAFVALVAQRLRFVCGLVAASTPAGPELLGLLEECARQMGVRRPVALRTLDTLPSPAVCGLRRPTILMPAALVERLSPEGLQAALIHELAHIRRADLWINAVQTLLQIVYFYNPFVWLANAVIRRTCEEAVDETVLVTLGGRAKNYSNTLIDISEMAFWKADFGLRLVGVAESRRILQRRIKHMLTRPIPKNTRIGTLGTIMILVVAAVLLPMARGTQGRQGGTSSLMDRVQQEDDAELSEMIRTAVANHKGASEKEILEITRRVTQSRAQILLLDAQIAQVARDLEATSASAETREKLLLTKKELETRRTTEMANLREALGIVPRPPLAPQSTANPTAFKLSPADGAKGVGVNNLELTWLAGDKAKAHNVYLGLGPENLTLLGQVQQAGAKVSHLKCNTKYYWRVDEIQGDGSVAIGNVYAFTTGGLVAWWKLDEESGDIAHDSSGSGNAGTLAGNPKWQPAGGRVGGALEFDGRGSFVRIGNETPFNVATAVSVGAWIKVHAFDRLFQTIVAKGDYSWRLARDRDRDALAFGAGPYEDKRMVRGEINVNDGKWHHVVGVGDGDNLSLYVDGVLDQAVTVRGQMRIDSTQVYIGENSEPTRGARYWNGWIDELCVFTYALSADEVKTLHAGTTPTALTAPPVSSEARILFAPLDTRARTVPAPRAELPFREQPTANLNAWLNLNVVDQRVYATDTLRPMLSDWSQWHFKPVGLLSDKETLDYVRTRLADKSSRPIRIDLYHHAGATASAAAELRGRILALIQETNAAAEAEVRLQPLNWVGTGTATYYLRANEIRTLYPRSVRMPDRGSRWMASGRVAPEDLEQHILWRLTFPGNVPVTVRIEYDEASANLARQVADTVKATAKRLGSAELVEVTGALVEPVPDTLFLGRWEALSIGEIKTIEVQPKGICLLTTREGSQAVKPGATESCPWVPITGDVIFSVEKDQIIKTPYLEVYRGHVNTEGDLVVDRVGIYPQGSIHLRNSAPMVFRKVQ